MIRFWFSLLFITSQFSPLFVQAQGYFGLEIKGPVLKVLDTQLDVSGKDSAAWVPRRNSWGYELRTINNKGQVTSIKYLDGGLEVDSETKFETKCYKDSCVIEYYEDQNLTGREIQIGQTSTTLISSIYNAENTKEMSIVSEFKNGKIIDEKFIDLDGEVSWHDQMFRNKKSGLVEKQITVQAGSAPVELSFQYEFDERKNWIVKRQYNEHGELDIIHRRTIIYKDDTREEKELKSFRGIWYDQKDRWIQFIHDGTFNAYHEEKGVQTGHWQLFPETGLIQLVSSEDGHAMKFYYQLDRAKISLQSIDQGRLVRELILR